MAVDKTKGEFVSQREFAQTIGVTEPTVEKWRNEGHIAAVQIGGPGSAVLIPRAEIARIRNMAQSNRVPTMHTAHGTLGGGALTPEAYGGFPAPTYANPDPDWGDDVDQDGFALNPEPVYQEPSVRLTTSKQRRDEAARRRAAALGDSDAIPVIGGDL